MRKELILALTLFSMISFAKEDSSFPQVKSWRIEKEYFRFLVFENVFLTASKKCFDIKKLPKVGFLKDSSFPLKCLALKKLKQLEHAKIPRDSLNGGKNPGAVLCRLALKGKVVMGWSVGPSSQSNNAQSFCHFADGSLLSNDTISAYAPKNFFEKKKSKGGK